MLARQSLRLALVATLALAFPAMANAALIVSVDATATPQPGGYLYHFTLTNQSTAGERVFDFSVGVDPASSISGVTAPPGWEIFYTPGDPLVEWLATPAGPDGLANTLAPGGSLLFSFLSPDAPATVPFTVLADAAGNLDFTEGSVTPRLQSSSTPVPEPGILAVFAFAGGGLLVMVRRRTGSVAQSFE